MALLVGALGTATSGCAMFSKEHAPTTIDLFAKKTTCALTNLDLPVDQMILKCMLTPDEVRRIVPMFTSAQASRDSAAAAAAARQAEKDQAAGVCR